MASPLLPQDPSFPAAFSQLTAVGLPPCTALYYRGAWPPPEGIAVVGTRAPTPEALDFTRTLAKAIVDAGWAVWSGGARGIDAAAHEAALERGGRTVVVMPSGFDEPYPPEHRALFSRVASSAGTLLSLVPETASPTQAAFHRRNAVLAALTLATVVVQAGYKSGARSTARAARKLGRPLYAVPHAPWDAHGQGCAVELSLGARALVAASALTADLGRPCKKGLPLPFVTMTATSSGAAPVRREAPSTEARAREHGRAHVAQALDPTEQHVLAAIGETPIHTDDLCDRTALPFGQVTAALLTLSLHAVVVEAPAGFYRRNTP